MDPATPAEKIRAVAVARILAETMWRKAVSCRSAVMAMIPNPCRNTVIALLNSNDRLPSWLQNSGLNLEILLIGAGKLTLR
ncbi:hypothetical protein GA830_03345 [Mesorhizobium sp. NBSH29]|nr:hypothetical protein GA830_03345 [Mesorhizobium sp. NBSH29]